MYRAGNATVVGGLLIALLVAPGCVGKKMFRNSLDDTDGRVAAVESAVEANQRQLNNLKKETDQKIQSLTGKTDQALSAGKEAKSIAEGARSMAQGKLLWTVTLTDDKVKFDFGKAALTSSAMRELDQLVSRLKGYSKALYVELEGHTDNVGTDQRNLSLGEQRAMVVRDYLNDRGIPLHALNTISYGESKPIADNSTKDGRAVNRRVVVKVLE